MRTSALLVALLACLGSSTTPAYYTTPKKQWCAKALAGGSMVCSAQYGECLDSRAALERGGTAMGLCMQR